eukprot:gene1572-1598_t
MPRAAGYVCPRRTRKDARRCGRVRWMIKPGSGSSCLGRMTGHGRPPQSGRVSWRALPSAHARHRSGAGQFGQAHGLVMMLAGMARCRVEHGQGKGQHRDQPRQFDKPRPPPYMAIQVRRFEQGHPMRGGWPRKETPDLHLTRQAAADATFSLWGGCVSGVRPFVASMVPSPARGMISGRYSGHFEQEAQTLHGDQGNRFARLTRRYWRHANPDPKTAAPPTALVDKLKDIYGENYFAEIEARNVTEIVELAENLKATTIWPQRRNKGVLPAGCKARRRPWPTSQKTFYLPVRNPK